MADTYRFKVLTPNRKALDDQVVSIVAPGELGYLGVLAFHAPLITTLKRGTLTVTFESGRKDEYTVAGGILKVANNEAILLTESIERFE